MPLHPSAEDGISLVMDTSVICGRQNETHDHASIVEAEVIGLENHSWHGFCRQKV
jgi:hypothetical protein